MTSRNLISLVAIAALILLGACGGGGGSGSSDPATFAGALMTAFPGIQSMDGPTPINSTTLDYSTPSNSMAGMGVDIPLSTIKSEMQFITLNFTRGIDIGTIFPNPSIVGTGGAFITTGGSSADGIVLDQVTTGMPDTTFRLLIDRFGTIDPTNALTGAETPTSLRLYIEDPAMPGVAGQFPQGDYRLTVVGPTTTNAAGLRTIDGEPFAQFVNSAGVGQNLLTSNYPFSVGGGNATFGLAPSPTDPVQGSTVALNQEFTVRFDDAVDLQSLIGNGSATTLSPFISQPLAITDVSAGGGVLPPGNLFVTYNSGNPAMLLPSNYGFVVYLPDPFRDPTQVRIRIVDNTTNSGVDNPVASLANPAPVPFPITTQNYGLDPAILSSIGLPQTTNNLGNSIGLPPALPLPGSQPGMTPATITVTVADSMNVNAIDTSAAGDMMVGATDRDRNILPATGVFPFTIDMGPTIANNPVAQDLAVAISGSRMGAVSSGRNTTTGTGQGPTLGQPVPVPNALTDSAVLGQILDVAFGFPVGPNQLLIAPRPANPAAALLGGGDFAIPMPQNGATGGILCSNAAVCPPAPADVFMAGVAYNPPHGDFLYVVDGTARELKIFNSNTYQQIGSVTGVATPSGLGTDPTFANLYVSNFDQGTLQRVNITPGTPTFNQVTAVTAVGPLPTAVAVQPANEDVWVINSGSSTASRVTVSSFTERIQTPLAPNSLDIMVTPRWICMGCTGAYQAFFPSQSANSVNVFESDSLVANVLNSNGFNGTNLQTVTGLSTPMFGDWNGLTGVTGGFYLANNGNSTAVEFSMTSFNLGPAPGFQGAPAFRIFTQTRTFNVPQSFGNPTDCEQDALTSLAGTANSVIYVATESGNVLLFSNATSALLGSVVTPASRLFTIASQ